jgi:glutaredoxin 3
MKHTIEIFSAGCPMCRDTINTVRKLAGSAHEVHVRDMQQPETAARAKNVGIRSVPAVLIDGTVASCCANRGPDEQVLRAALQ